MDGGNESFCLLPVIVEVALRLYHCIYYHNHTTHVMSQAALSLRSWVDCTFAQTNAAGIYWKLTSNPWFAEMLHLLSEMPNRKQKESSICWQNWISKQTLFWRWFVEGFTAGLCPARSARFPMMPQLMEHFSWSVASLRGPPKIYWSFISLWASWLPPEK